MSTGEVRQYVASLQAELKAGRWDDVEVTCRSMIAESFHALGEVELRRRRPDHAARYFHQAVQIDGQRAEWQFELAAALHQSGESQQAIQAYRRAVALKPDYAAAYHNLGVLLRDQGQFAAAAAALREALRYAPEQALTHRALGMGLRRLWEFDAAEEHLRQALELLPDDVTTATALAELLEKRGRFDEAWQCLQSLVEQRTRDPLALKIYANLSHRIGRQRDARDLLEAALAVDTLSSDDRGSLHFALGKLLDKQHHYETAFEHFQRGNALSPHVFDPDAHSRYVDALISNFSEHAPDAPRAQIPTSQLIFIVGMPRSGTTLVEQILASHPHVHGAGELLWVQRLTESLPKRLGSSLPYPQCLSELSQATADQLAEHYLQIVGQRAKAAVRVTDKMTFNFLHLGLIARLFPQARIIHCTRNALDCGISCYFNELGPYNAYSSNLEHIGRYYNDYRRLMAHWQRTLDLPIHTVEYEHMAHDFDTQVRELIAFCGLQWNDRCLRYYETDRAVITSSYDQVRQPIYRSSIDRWRNYERQVQPLRTALAAEEVPADAGA
jgi:tetratricopeptide (TPR) repeat protein